MAEGHVIFSPIAHTHPIAVAGVLPTDWAYWQKFDEEFIAASTELWVYTLIGWRKSRGVGAEIGLAQQFGKPISLVSPGTLTVSEYKPEQRSGT